VTTEKRRLVSSVVVIGVLAVWPQGAAGKNTGTAGWRSSDPPVVRHVSLTPATAAGSETAKLAWTPVMTGGFGDPGNALLRGLEVFAGRLYAITFDDDGGEIYRSVTTDPLTWERVVDRGLSGFGNSFTPNFRSAAICTSGRSKITSRRRGEDAHRIKGLSCGAMTLTRARGRPKRRTGLATRTVPGSARFSPGGGRCTWAR